MYEVYCLKGTTLQLLLSFIVAASVHIFVKILGTIVNNVYVKREPWKYKKMDTVVIDTMRMRRLVTYSST